MKFRGLSVPRAQREPAGKLEQRSVRIITVTTHICRSLCCSPSAPSHINSTGASLGKEVGRISLRIFPVLCVSRMNGFKQITNRLNKLPLVKQKSNYMMGNCSNLSPASAHGSRGWFQPPRAPAVNAPGQRDLGRPPPLRCQDKSSCLEEGLGEGPKFPSGNSGDLLVHRVLTDWAGLGLDGCLHAIISFLSTIYLPGKESHSPTFDG